MINNRILRRVCFEAARRGLFLQKMGALGLQLFVCLGGPSMGLCVTERHILESDQVVVLFASPLQKVARQVVDLFPDMKKDLEGLFGWDFPSRPTVLLCHQREQFSLMASSSKIVAFAVPEKALVVLDYSTLKGDPFLLGITLKHELCHLLLHAHIQEAHLPRWFEEGVCEWVSEGIGEIISGQRRSLLNKAAISEGFIPFRMLEKSFPGNPDRLLLAYEQSKSFVLYLIRRFGRNAVFQILDRLKEGEDFNNAIFNTTEHSLPTLELDWRKSLKRKMSWFVYGTYYLYEILFGGAALLGLYAFIRLIKKRRAYQDMEED
jgi:hypothetical protein